MQRLLTIGNDRGTPWDRLYRPLQSPPLPPVVDLRPGLFNVGIEVYDQAPLESCTANAICTAWRFAQAPVDRGFTPSRLFLYYNERLVEHTTSQDKGAFITDGCRSLMTFGVCSERSWPYMPMNEPIRPPRYAYDEAKRHIIHTPAKIDNINFLKYSLLENKPFVVGITLYPEFFDDNTTYSGKVPMPFPGQAPKGGHAVLCVGYNDLEGVWIFRNSWGPYWGDQGHFYLPYEYLIEERLASDFWNIATDYQET